MLERFRYDVTKVGIAEGELVKRTITGDITIHAGEPLYRVDSKAQYKACSSRGPCGLDDDGDGKFDRIALNETVRAFKLDAPVPYHIVDAPIETAQGNFKQVITYLGVSGDTLRLTYREFMNDMARPAFTEDLTIPLGKTFPQMVALKDVKLTITGIDGMGLHYRIEP